MNAVIFWVCFSIVLYTYVGYGLLLWLLTLPAKKNKQTSILEEEALPHVSFIIAAYNEEDYIIAKIKNSLALDYPPEKLTIFFVTDGSNDRTTQLIESFPHHGEPKIISAFKAERAGKNAAIDRIMPLITSPIVVFSDANTMVNSSALRNIVRHYLNPRVGGVAGEKRIQVDKEGGSAASSGEGLYWKYESWLKQRDADFHTCIGAAGELFSIRTSLYEPVPADSITEDFMLSMSVNEKGFTMAYEPEAYAVESSSADVSEEMKRKVRIAAGGIQAFFRLMHLLNPFRYGKLSFQYLSHRVMRWIFAPLALPVLFFSNIYLSLTGNHLYILLMAGQLSFYLLAFVGYLLRKRKITFNVLFAPYYFCLMNYGMYAGGLRYFSGRQNPVWEKSKRAGQGLPIDSNH